MNSAQQQYFYIDCFKIKVASKLIHLPARITRQAPPSPQKEGQCPNLASLTQPQPHQEKLQDEPSCNVVESTQSSLMIEVFSAIGFPARVLGRVPLLTRYASGFGRKPSSYGLERYGPSYIWRLWLRLDAAELESIETLVNKGSEEDIEAFRATHLATSGSTAVVVSTD